MKLQPFRYAALTIILVLGMLTPMGMHGVFASSILEVSGTVGPAICSPSYGAMWNSANNTCTILAGTEWDIIANTSLTNPGSTSSSSAVTLVNYGSLVSNGTFNEAGNFIGSNGSTMFVNNGGYITFTNGSTGNIPRGGSLTLNGGTLALNGTLTNQGTITGAKRSYLIIGHGATLSFLDLGSLNEDGTVILGDANLTVGGSGTLNLSSNSTLTVGGNSTLIVGANGSITMGGNSTLTINKNSTIKVGGSGHVTVTGNGAITLGDGAIFALNGGTLTENGTLTIGGSGTLNLSSNSTISVGGSGTLTVGGNGTLKIGGSSTITVNKNSTIKVGGGGSINVTGNGSLSIGGGGVLKNNGTLIDDGTVTIRKIASFHNFGTVTLKRGLINSGSFWNWYQGIVNNTGTLTNAVGAALFNYGKIYNYGTIDNTGSIILEPGSQLLNEPGSTYTGAPPTNSAPVFSSSLLLLGLTLPSLFALARRYRKHL